MPALSRVLEWLSRGVLPALALVWVGSRHGALGYLGWIGAGTGVFLFLLGHAFGAAGLRLGVAGVRLYLDERRRRARDREIAQER